MTQTELLSILIVYIVLCPTQTLHQKLNCISESRNPVARVWFMYHIFLLYPLCRYASRLCEVAFSTSEHSKESQKSCHKRKKNFYLEPSVFIKFHAKILNHKHRKRVTKNKMWNIIRFKRSNQYLFKIEVKCCSNTRTTITKSFSSHEPRDLENASGLERHQNTVARCVCVRFWKRYATR